MLDFLTNPQSREIVFLAIALVGWIVAEVQRRIPRLQREDMAWLSKIGGPTAALQAIEFAERFDTQEERRREAVGFLQKLAAQKMHIPMPDSVANLLVEWAVRLYKTRIKSG